MNIVALVGRITHDLDLNKHEDRVYARFSLAVQGYGENVDYINCIAWGDLASNLVKYMKKGSRVGVTGRIATGKYEHETKGTVYTTDIVATSIDFLESKSESEDKKDSKVVKENLPF